MKRPLLLTLSLASISLLAACAAGHPDSVVTTLVKVDDIATGAYQTRPSIVEVDGKVAVLHSTRQDRVALQIGEQKQLMDETARVKQGGSYLKLHRIDQKLAATWWSHQSGKNIYYTSSTDGGKQFAPVSMVNAENGVLPPFHLVSGPQGELGMIYHDERLPNYQAFFNRSTDFGRTWSQQDQRLDTPPVNGRSSDAHEPQLIQSGNVWLGAWTELVNIDGKARYQLVSRHSVDAGQSWSQPTVLYSADHQFFSLIARASGTNFVIAADELQRGVFALSSQDAGRTWQNLGAVAGTDGVSNSGIDMAVAAGRAHLTWMQDRPEQKTHVLQATVDIAQNKWISPAQRLDVKAVENTRSISPVILATQQGPLVAAWVDFRDIRPNIYLSASYDQGQKWSAPKPLNKPGELWLGWPQLIAFSDQVAIGHEVYPTDKPTTGHFIVKQLAIGEANNSLPGLPEAAVSNDAERRVKLERRIKEMWDARIAGDYEKAYDSFDFVYKAMMPKSLYLQQAGVITYLQSTVDKIEIKGNEAFVNMKLKYEMKPTMTPFSQKPIAVAPVDVESPNTWVWVGNDWYFVYAPSFEPQPLKY